MLWAPGERLFAEGRRPDEIVAAIRVVARGDALIQPSVMRRLVETFVAARPAGGWGAADVAETRRAALTSLTGP